MDKVDNKTHKQKWKFRLLCWGGIVMPLVVLLFLGPGLGLFNYILVYQSPEKTAEVMLVGGAGETIETAVKNFNQGKVKALLIIRGVPEKYRGLKGNVCAHNLILNDLRERGIPTEKIFSFSEDPQSMLDKQIMLRKSMLRNGFSSYLCYPPDYASGFTKIIHKHTFPEGKVKAIIKPTSGKRVFRKHWLAVQNSLIRMAFWMVHYRPAMREWIENHTLRIENEHDA